MRYIRLAAHETRCRPAHNDCGRQADCARKLAANLQGAPQKDLSVDCRQVWGAMVCGWFLSVPEAERRADERPTKEWIGARS